MTHQTFRWCLVLTHPEAFQPILSDRTSVFLQPSYVFVFRFCFIIYINNYWGSGYPRNKTQDIRSCLFFLFLAQLSNLLSVTVRYDCKSECIVTERAVLNFRLFTLVI